MAEKEPDHEIADELISLLLLHTQATSVVLENALRALEVPVASFHDWYTFGAVGDLVKLMAKMLVAYEVQAARNADSYMSRALSIIHGKRVPPAGVRKTELGRRGVSREETLERVAASYRFQQAEQEKVFDQGKLLASPREAASERLSRIVDTNLQLANRNQLQMTMQESGLATGWRRIPHPELAHEGTCGLCLAAADRVYRVDHLMPIHPGCHCGQLPIVGARDPGHALNERDFQTIYSATGGSAAGEDLRKTRFRVDDHGEIGPVIRPEGEPIRSKAQAKRAQARKSPKPTQSVRQTLENKRNNLADRLAKVEKDLANGNIQSSGDWDAIIPAMHTRIEDLERQIAAMR